MNKKLSASVATLFEIYNKLSIECCNDDEHCTIGGIEIGKCMGSIEYKSYKIIPKLSVLDAVFMGKLSLLKIWSCVNRILRKELQKNFVSWVGRNSNPFLY